MSERKNPSALVVAPTRRQVIAGAAIAFGSLATGADAWGKTQHAATEPPSAGADKLRTYLHQEVDFKASPQRIYEALLDSKQFAAFTGLPAEIDPKAGGAFSMFGGLIVGRNIELIPTSESCRRGGPRAGTRASIRSSSLNSKSRVRKPKLFSITQVFRKANSGASTRDGTRSIGSR
jgi:hypothetical protein